MGFLAHSWVTSRQWFLCGLSAVLRLFDLTWILPLVVRHWSELSTAVGHVPLYVSWGPFVLSNFSNSLSVLVKVLRLIQLTHTNCPPVLACHLWRVCLLSWLSPLWSCSFFGLPISLFPSLSQSHSSAAVSACCRECLLLLFLFLLLLLWRAALLRWRSFFLWRVLYYLTLSGAYSLPNPLPNPDHPPLTSPW